MNAVIAIAQPPKKLLSFLEGDTIAHVKEPESLKAIISQRNCDVIFLEGDIALISEMKLMDPRVEVIFFGESDEEELAAIQQGAYGYFSVADDRLGSALDGIRALVDNRREIGELEKKLYTKFIYCGIVGKNPKMLDIQSTIMRIAPYYQTVLVTGDTGTGKELVARAIHTASPNSTQPFVACNCGSLMDSLMGSDLFGHKKGAFTGAISDKKGLFEIAGNGAIFLDEIGELPMALQPHFLRVLQSGEYQPVGGEQKKIATCKVIAATNKDLSHAVSKGTFREDLFYRISQFVLHVPPLRERKDDIPLLSRYFLEKFVEKTGKKVFGISRPAQKAFLDYDWPGNVRELENVVEHAAVMTAENFIRLQDLPDNIQRSNGEPGAMIHRSTGPSKKLDDVIRTHIAQVLAECSDNRTEAAKRLGISRFALLRKLEKYSIRQGRPDQ